MTACLITVLFWLTLAVCAQKLLALPLPQKYLKSRYVAQIRECFAIFIAIAYAFYALRRAKIRHYMDPNSALRTRKLAEEFDDL